MLRRTGEQTIWGQSMVHLGSSPSRARDGDNLGGAVPANSWPRGHPPEARGRSSAQARLLLRLGEGGRIFLLQSARGVLEDSKSSSFGAGVGAGPPNILI